MKKTSLEICMRYVQLRSDLLHGGYMGEFLVEEIVNVLVDEILSDLDVLKDPNEIKNMMIIMFHLGRHSK